MKKLVNLLKVIFIFLYLVFRKYNFYFSIFILFLFILLELIVFIRHKNNISFIDYLVDKIGLISILFSFVLTEHVVLVNLLLELSIVLITLYMHFKNYPKKILLIDRIGYLLLFVFSLFTLLINKFFSFDKVCEFLWMFMSIWQLLTIWTLKEDIMLVRNKIKIEERYKKIQNKNSN